MDGLRFPSCCPAAEEAERDQRPCGTVGGRNCAARALETDDVRRSTKRNGWLTRIDREVWNIVEHSPRHTG